MQEFDIRIDVTSAVALAEPLETAVTIFVPEHVATRPIVCFAFPGGGYNRRYFSLDVYEDERRGQAGWHAERGWVFAACDYLGAGDSTHPGDPGRLTFEDIAAANHATVHEVLRRLRAGTIGAAVPKLDAPFTIGIGHSLGAAFLIVQQGQFGTFDAIGVFGSSARHTSAWVPTGTRRLPRRFVPRGTNVARLSPKIHHDAVPEMATGPDGMPRGTPGFHFENVSREIVVRDMVDYPTRGGRMPVWGSATMPPCTVTVMSPGAVAPEAAMISCPVLLGFGERDLSADPRAEPSAYPSATDVSLFVCSGMAHMHNFAIPRQRLWSRLQAWGDAIPVTRDAVNVRLCG